MSDHRPIWVIVLFLLICVPWALSKYKPLDVTSAPTVEAKMAEAGIACSTCIDIPADLVRFRKTVLTKGLTILTPTKPYLSFIAGICADKNRWTGIGQRECNKDVSRIARLGDGDETVINPIYGRLALTEDQMLDLWWSSIAAEGLSARFEHNWVRTMKDRYLRMQRRSKAS